VYTLQIARDLGRVDDVARTIVGWHTVGEPSLAIAASAG